MADKDLLLRVEYEDFSFYSASFRFLQKYVLDSTKSFENFIFIKGEPKLLKPVLLINIKSIEEFKFLKAEYRRLASKLIRTKNSVEEFGLTVAYTKPKTPILFTEKDFEAVSFTINYRVLRNCRLQTAIIYENFDAIIHAHKLFHYLLDTNSAIEDFFVIASGRISSHKILSKDNLEDIEINIIAPGYEILGQCVLKKCNLKPGETIVIDSDEYVVLKNTVSIESPKWNLGTASLSNGKISSSDHRGCYTDFIKVTEDEKIYHTETKIDNIRYQYALFYTNDNDTSYVSGSSVTLKNNDYFTVPENAEYMIIGLYKTEGYSFDNDYTNADIQFWRKGDELYKEAVYMQSGDWIDELDQNISLLGIQDVVGSNGLSASIEYIERFY